MCAQRTHQADIIIRCAEKCIDEQRSKARENPHTQTYLEVERKGVLNESHLYILFVYNEYIYSTHA